MALTVDQTTLKSRLNLALGDSSNIVFSDAEKTEMLRKAVADPLVYSICEFNQAVTYNQRSYTLDDSYEAIVSVGYDAQGDGFPLPLPGDAYEYVGGKLLINRAYMNLPGSVNFVIQAAKKWNWDVDTTTIPSYLAEYIVEKAVVISHEFLANKKANLFLRNKTSMGELLARINEAKQNVRELRRSLRNQKLVRI